MSQKDSPCVDSIKPDKQSSTDNRDNETINSESDSEPDSSECHNSGSVTPAIRADVLERDNYRCQVCGRGGPERGELATLHVHHIERNPDPDTLDPDSPENLTTLCRSCHNWIHQQETRDNVPVTLTEDDLSVLLSQDIEILRYLADEGPATTGEVARALTADLSLTAVRERLAVLMGLDNIVQSRDRQILDQDIETGKWGLVEQIESSARGHIPSDPRTLIQRVEDEIVRQALDRGCDRQAIIDVLDVSRRTTFHREKRARAYDFPLDAFRGGGGSPTHDNQRRETTAGDSDTSETMEQQQIDAGDDYTNHGQNNDLELTQDQLQMVVAALERVAAER